MIPYITDKIYCNMKQLPEYIPSENSHFAMISNGTRFCYHPQNEVICGIIENAIHLLQSYVDDHGDDLGMKLIEKI